MSQVDPLPPPQFPAPQQRPHRGSSSLWTGAIIVLVGAYFLLRNLGFLDWLSWDIVWPVVLIVVGVVLVARRFR